MSSASLVFKHSATRNDAITPNNNDNNRSISREHNTEKVNELLNEFNSYYRSEEGNATDDLYEYLNSGPTIFRTTTERSNLTVEEKTILISKDADFFKNCKLQMPNV